MKVRPLGWELTTALGLILAMLVFGALGLEASVLAALGLLALITPVIVLSAGVRLITGIVDEDRRYRRAKAASGREGRRA